MCGLHLKTEAAFNPDLHISAEYWLYKNTIVKFLSEETQFMLAVPISKMAGTLPAAKRLSRIKKITIGRKQYTFTSTLA
jgi:hypothetical protein